MAKRSEGVERLINENIGIVQIQEMEHKQPGFDYVAYNTNNIAIKGEHKDRKKGLKVDVTPYQEEQMRKGITKVISLMTKHDKKQYHMTAEKYLKLGNVHSAVASGYEGKSWEVKQIDFINNAYTNFYEFINDVNVEDNMNMVNLETFMS